jgi:hypothetical protein
MVYGGPFLGDGVDRKEKLEKIMPEEIMPED